MYICPDYRINNTQDKKQFVQICFCDKRITPVFR